MFAGETKCSAMPHYLHQASLAQELPEQEEPIQPGKQHNQFESYVCSWNQVGLTAVNIIGTPLEKAESQNGFSLDGDIWSLYDDLSFLMYTDTEVAQLINKLEKKKFEAVATERFEYAKKIKSAISK